MTTVALSDAPALVVEPKTALGAGSGGSDQTTSPLPVENDTWNLTRGGEDGPAAAPLPSSSSSSSSSLSSGSTGNNQPEDQQNRNLNHDTATPHPLSIYEVTDQDRGPPPEELERWGRTALCRTGFPIKARGPRNPDSSKTWFEKLELFTKRLGVLGGRTSGPQSDSPSGGSFSPLPDALITRILSFLDAEELCIVAQTCKRLSELGNGAELWKDLHERYFGAFCFVHFGRDGLWREPLRDIEWKKAFVYRTKGLKAKKRAAVEASEDSCEELFVDVIEKVRTLVYPNGKLGRCIVSGKIQARCYLGGIPFLELQFNPPGSSDDLSEIDRVPEVVLDDLTFHPCVDVDSFSRGNSLVRFIPPGSETFELLRYKLANVEREQLPIDMVASYIKDLDTNTFAIDVVLRSSLDDNCVPAYVMVKAPTPKTASKCKIQVSSGKAEFKSSRSAIFWKLPSLRGRKECHFSAKVRFNPNEVDWDRPPVELTCELGNASVSTFRVRRITVMDKSTEVAVLKEPLKWIRYITEYRAFQHLV